MLGPGYKLRKSYLINTRGRLINRPSFELQLEISTKPPVRTLDRPPWHNPGIRTQKTRTSKLLVTPERAKSGSIEKDAVAVPQTAREEGIWQPLINSGTSRSVVQIIGFVL